MSMAVKLSKANYAGDPGLFGDIIGGIGKGLGFVAKTAGGLVPGPAGAVLRGVGGILGGRRRARTPAPGTGMVAGGPMIGTRPPGAVGYGGMAGGFPILTTGRGMMPTNGFAAPTPAQRELRGEMGLQQYAGQAPPSGYHLNKSGYFLKSGVYVAPGTKWVKNRRRNPGNMRALDRAIGRVGSSKRMASKLSGITIRKNHKCPK